MPRFLQHARTFHAAIALAVLAACCADVVADDEPIIRVEEDWEIKTTTPIPDPDKSMPQVIHVISPTGNLNGSYAVLELNHRSLPTFSPGGFQMQLWHNKTHIKSATGQATARLRFAEEKITYTLQMKISQCDVTYAVINGQSQSWGEFSTPGQSIHYNSSDGIGCTLSNYSPTFSTTNAAVGKGAHCLYSVILRSVRYYSAEGLEKTEQLDKVVHQYSAKVE